MGKTIFLSSHILTELADVCTSVAILERGRLVVAGPIHDIARRLEARTAEEQPPAPSPMAHVERGAPSAVPAQPQRIAKLKVLAPGEAVASALAGMPFVFKVGPGPGGTVVVAYAGDERALAAIVKAVVMAGVPVAGVEPERNELERIFLEVTRGEVQ
jgi:ABC-2 type transport system ATP-binding protein